MVPMLLMITAVAAEPVPAWPGFLGAGVSQIKPASIPLQWSPGRNIAWSVSLDGYGQSSPVIFDKHVFVTSVAGPLKDDLIVDCRRLADGHRVWHRTFNTSDPVENDTFVSRAAPTPVVDVDGIYCFFESGDVVALTHAGELIWQESLTKKFGRFENKYGLAASPVLHNGLLMLLIDHPGPSYVIALDKRTGKQLWKTERESRGSWTSPVLLPVEGGHHLLCSSAGTIDGYDPATGKLLWSYSPVGGNRICTPFVYETGQFLVGSQTSREFSDTEAVKKSNFAMHVRHEDDEWIPLVEWRNEEFTPGMASPMVHRGCAYWVNRSGAVLCLNADSGETNSTGRLAQSCWATPLGLGQHVYFFGKDGLTTVIKAGPRFEVVAENWLWDPESIQPDPAIVERETDPKRRMAAAMHATPEVMGIACVTGRLLIRTGEKLYCVRRTRSESADGGRRLERRREASDGGDGR